MRIQEIIAITTTLLAGGGFVSSASSSDSLSKKRPSLSSSSSSSSSSYNVRRDSGEKSAKKKGGAFKTPDGETAGQSGQKDFLRDNEMNMLCEQQERAAGELCEWIGYLDGMVRDNLELFARTDILKVRTRLNKLLATRSEENKENNDVVNFRDVIGHLRTAVEALQKLKMMMSGDPLGQIHRLVLGLALLIDHSLGGSAPHDTCLTAYKSLPANYPLWTQRKEKAIVDGFILRSQGDIFCAGPLMVLKLLASFDGQKPGFTSLLNKLEIISKNPNKITPASDVQLIKAVMAEPLGLKNTITILDSLLGDAINRVHIPPTLSETGRTRSSSSSSSKTSFGGRSRSSISRTSFSGTSSGTSLSGGKISSSSSKTPSLSGKSSSSKTPVASKTGNPPSKASFSGKAKSSSSKTTSVYGNPIRPETSFGEQDFWFDDIHPEAEPFSVANADVKNLPKGATKFWDALYLKEPMYSRKKEEGS